MFIDELTLKLSAGNGGDGVVRWHREKYKPKGGPSGGNGGRGGHINITGTNDLSYLENYRFIKEIKGNNGKPGSKMEMEGKNGEDKDIKVPFGSIVTDKNTGKTYEITKENPTHQVLKGGRGGLGNAHFKSSTNTTPQEFTPGQIGESSTFHIELRLIADIGLVGFPNAGKSTLLNELTGANSKIGSYQFTTLEPHLGVLKNGKIIADIPGLIEGAKDGKGLGHKFLRHIMRTKTIAHLISCENDDVKKAYDTIRHELESYNKELGDKPEIVILTKIDECQDYEKQQKILEKHTKKTVIPITAFSSDNIKSLSEYLMQT